MTDKREPYVGPRPFKKDERELFFGRDHEADELVSLITAHPVVVLYAQSGAGKSSLLNAKVIPKLESDEEGFEVLGPLRVHGQLPANFVADKNTNIYVLNALLSQNQAKDPDRLSKLTLSEFLDQRAPRLNRFNEPAPRLIIFDQFEELFTSYAEHWEQRAAFFTQVRDALEASAAKVPLRVVFAMREDYIAELDPYASLLPENMRSRYRLEGLGPVSALSAITKPVLGTGRSYDEGVAQQIVENLRKLPGPIGEAPKLGPSVEPVQLQVVCQSIWQALGPTETLVTQSHVKDYGDVNRALSAFYERSIITVSGKTLVPEAALRSWFGNTLITSDGMRAPVYRGEESTEGLPNSAVDLLDSMQLIKSELKGSSARWYELAHDRFIEPVRKSNEGWLGAQSLAEQSRVRLETKADRWRQGHGGLLDAVELSEGRRLLKSRQSQSGDLRALVDASRASEQRKRLKWLTTGFGALAFLLVVMSGLTVFAFAQRRYSRDASAEAARQTAEAEKQRAEAERERVRRQIDLAQQSSAAQEMESRRAQIALKTLEAEKTKTDQQRTAAENALVAANEERRRATANQRIAEAQLTTIRQQQEVIKEDSWLESDKPVVITPETAPAFDKIKNDIAYATSFLNSLFGLNLNSPELKPLSENHRNAYWDSYAVNVPPAVQFLPDVAYHETSHLFIDKVLAGAANDIESLAIQESYADIYASLIKQQKLGQTAQEADWVIAPGAVAWLKAEDLANSSDKRPLHSLKSPGTAYDDPVVGKDMQVGHMRNFKEGQTPYTGVNINGGIPSKAFYETAIKIGSTQAGAIWTEALKDPRFRSETKIKRLAQVTYEVAVRLHGMNSKESQVVKSAWDTVGVSVQ